MILIYYWQRILNILNTIWSLRNFQRSLILLIIGLMLIKHVSDFEKGFDNYKLNFN